MTVYHVDLCYGKNDKKYYIVMPYSFGGTLRVFFGGCYYPRRRAFSDFIKWIKASRLTEKAAEKLARELEHRL